MLPSRQMLFAMLIQQLYVVLVQIEFDTRRFASTGSLSSSAEAALHSPWSSAGRGGATYQYMREDIAYLFVTVEPLVGRRHVSVTERRTKHDCAECLRWLTEQCYPWRWLRSHRLGPSQHARDGGALQGFPSEQARAIATWASFLSPTHSSWPNPDGIEIRIVERDTARAAIHLQFTSRQVCTALADLYPISPPAMTNNDLRRAPPAYRHGTYGWPTRPRRCTQHHPKWPYTSIRLPESRLAGA
jgi:hypothetical protein